MAFVVAAFSTSNARKAAEKWLHGAGHTCVSFDKGAAAVAEAQAGTPDLLLIDTDLADLTVSDICILMSSRADTAGVPIVTCGRTGLVEPAGCLLDDRLLHTTLNQETVLDAVARAVARQAASPAAVLLVEDDDAIAVPLVDGLARYGVRVDRVATGSAALAAPPAAMVLPDLGLPDIDGLEVCRQLRLRSDTPIIMLTARGDETDRVVGLELGADDYLAKPFSLRELVARIRAVGRRTRLAAPAVETARRPEPAVLGRSR